MKQLKCDNCGATIKINDENSEFATCPYCEAKYQLNERKDIYIRMDDNTKELLTNGFNFFKKSSKLVIIPAIIIFIIVIAIFIIIFANIFNSSHIELKDGDNHIKINNNDMMVEVKEKMNKSFFNSSFETYSGTNSKFLTEPLLDNIVTNNKTNKDMLITVIYKDNETTDPEEIIKIKHSLDDKKKYEIKLDYDDDGYVNKVTIEDI